MAIFDDIFGRNGPLADTYTGNSAGSGGYFAGSGGYGGNFNGPYRNPMVGAPFQSPYQGMQQPNFDQQQLAQMQAFQNRAFQGQNPYAQNYEELFRDNSVTQPTKKPKPVKAVKPIDNVRRLDLDGGSEVATPAVVVRQIDF